MLRAAEHRLHHGRRPGDGHLGFNGQTKIRTPNIDRLRSQGRYFTQAYAGCAVCAPSRSVLMTGYHMGHTSVRGNSGGIPLLAQDVTVAEVLKKAGYATGAFGKWGLGDAHTAGMATRQGFDTFFGYYHQVHAHSYYPAYLWHDEAKYFLPGNSGRESDGLTGDVRVQYTHDEIHTKALDFIHAHRDGPSSATCRTRFRTRSCSYPGTRWRSMPASSRSRIRTSPRAKHYQDQLSPARPTRP
jgi:arylsulfatase A